MCPHAIFVLGLILSVVPIPLVCRTIQGPSTYWCTHADLPYTRTACYWPCTAARCSPIQHCTCRSCSTSITSLLPRFYPVVRVFVQLANSLSFCSDALAKACITSPQQTMRTLGLSGTFDLMEVHTVLHAYCMHVKEFHYSLKTLSCPGVP